MLLALFHFEGEICSCFTPLPVYIPPHYSSPISSPSCSLLYLIRLEITVLSDWVAHSLSRFLRLCLSRFPLDPPDSISNWVGLQRDRPWIETGTSKRIPFVSINYKNLLMIRIPIIWLPNFQKYTKFLSTTAIRKINTRVRDRIGIYLQIIYSKISLWFVHCQNGIPIDCHCIKLR